LAEVGVAFVSIVPSAKGFGAKLNSEVGPASANAGKTSSKKFGGAFAGGFKGALAGVGIASVVAGGVSLLKGAVAEAREAQKVGALTTAIIKATGGAANVSAGQVGKLATSLSNKTAVDDEVIQKGANLLLTFKNVRNEAGKGNKVFDQATAAAVDLSAAGFGSVDSASKMLGKALNDPLKGLTALGRAGVTFTAGQEKQIKALVKSGDVLGAQKIILGEVKSQVGGAAAASATAGERMKVAFDNAKESLGTALLPSIDKLQNAITTKIIPAIVKFIGFLQKNPAIVKAFAIGIAAIAAAFVVAFVAANAIIIGIGLLVGAIVAAYLKFETFLTIVNAVFSFIAGFIKFQIQLIILAVKVGIAIIVAVWGFLKKIPGIVRTVFNFVKSVISTVVGFIVGFIRGAINKVLAIWRGIQKIAGFVRSAFNTARSVISSAMSAVVGFIRSGIDKAVGFFRGLLGKIKSALGNAKNALVQAGKKFASKLGLASPSKLFAKYGAWTVEGYVKGIKGETPTVTPAIGALADATIGAGAGIGSRFSAGNVAASSGAVAIGDRPIVDGSQVIGYLRDIATNRARIEIASNDLQAATSTRLG
jgi:hypothetical protein